METVEGRAEIDQLRAEVATLRTEVALLTSAFGDLMESLARHLEGCPARAA